MSGRRVEHKSIVHKLQPYALWQDESQSTNILMHFLPLALV